MNQTRPRTAAWHGSWLKASAALLTLLAATACAGTGATPTTAPPISPEPATARPGTPTYPGFESPETTSLALSPFSTAESGVLEIVEPQPEVFGSVIYVRAEGSLLLAGDTSGTISLFSLDDPTQPRLLSQLSLGNETYQEMQIVLGDMQVVQRTHAVEIRAMALDGTRLYIITKSMLHVADLGDPSAPRPLGRLSIGPRLNDLLVSDGRVTVLVADTLHDTLDLDVIDARNPQAMTIVSQALFPGAPAARARFHGGLVYVTDRELTTAPDLALYSIADPAQPAFIGTVPGIPAFRAWMDDGRAFIVTGQLIDVRGVGVSTEQAAIQIVDLSDPGRPLPIGGFTLRELAVDLAVNEDTLAVVYNLTVAGELLVVDLQSLAQPEVLRAVEFEGEPQALTYAAGHVYVAAGQAGILVFDPGTGTLVSSVTAEDLNLP